MARKRGPFEIWSERRQREGSNVTLIVLYRIAAEARGLAAHELPLAERAALRDRALPVMWPGYQAPAGTERAEDPVEIVAYDPAWPTTNLLATHTLLRSSRQPAAGATIESLTPTPRPR